MEKGKMAFELPTVIEGQLLSAGLGISDERAEELLNNAVEVTKTAFKQAQESNAEGLQLHILFQQWSEPCNTTQEVVYAIHVGQSILESQSQRNPFDAMMEAFSAEGEEDVK